MLTLFDVNVRMLALYIWNLKAYSAWMYWPIVPWNFIMALWFVNQVYLDVFKNTVGVVQKHKQPAADTETFTTESQTVLGGPINRQVMRKRYCSERKSTKQSRTAGAIVKTNILLMEIRSWNKSDTATFFWSKTDRPSLDDVFRKL